MEPTTGRRSPLPLIATVLLVALGLSCASLMLRASALEAEIADLRRTVEQAAAKAAEPSASAPSGAPSPTAADRSVTARLDAIEDDLAQLLFDYAGLDEQLAGTTKGTTDESRILDVVTRAQSRVRQRQLEFHGSHFRKTRSSLIEHFASQQGLERWQTDQLLGLLQEEADSMIDILVQPETAEDPELAARRWQRRLEQTDMEAQRVLEPPQLAAWLGARAFERQVLWPWLQLADDR